MLTVEREGREEVFTVERGKEGGGVYSRTGRESAEPYGGRVRVVVVLVQWRVGSKRQQDE